LQSKTQNKATLCWNCDFGSEIELNNIIIRDTAEYTGSSELQSEHDADSV